MQLRQIAFDTETTGREIALGHRLIEVGCVEIVNHQRTGRIYSARINPGRPIDPDAQRVHGISDEDVAAAPSFSQVAAPLWEFLADSELIIHNAAFDLSFLDLEFSLCGHHVVSGHLPIIDTLRLARQRHPGAPNSLDALCRRYGVDASRRVRHGALVDAELLADVFLAMTGGQAALVYEGASQNGAARSLLLEALTADRDRPIPVLLASHEELGMHQQRLSEIRLAHIKTLKGKLQAQESKLREIAKKIESSPDALGAEKLRKEAARAQVELSETLQQLTDQEDRKGSGW